MPDKHELVQLDKLPLYIEIHQQNNESDVAPHWHQSIELSFTMRGQIAHFIINGVDHHTHPGEILVINSQVVHSVRSSTSSCSDLMLTMLFPYSLVLQVFPEMDQYMIDLKPLAELSVEQIAQYHHLQALLSRITETKLANDSEFQNLELTILSYQVLEILLKYFLRTRDNNSQLSSNLLITGHLRRALDFIQDHYQEPFSLQDIADSCHLARQYLQRIFRQNMGITLGKYIRNYRAQRAYQELCGTSHTLTAVAMNNGFSGVRSLNRAMIANYGQTSMQIRKGSSAPDSGD